jgi:hypothetical protein
MTTAVVKLDSLPDAIGAGTEDHDLASVMSERIHLLIRRLSRDRE